MTPVSNPNRRHVVIGLLATPAVASAARAAEEIIVYRDPGCGCCVKWGGQVKAALRRAVKFVDAPNRALIQRRIGVPDTLSSCHTAIIDGLIFEGHVPIQDLKLQLIMRPNGVQGLAVKDMPQGSLGMENTDGTREAYAVIAFGRTGQRVYARH
jgi:hypothetical protein